jgi:hypothetical protein
LWLCPKAIERCAALLPDIDGKLPDIHAPVADLDRLDQQHVNRLGMGTLDRRAKGGLTHSRCGHSCGFGAAGIPDRRTFWLLDWRGSGNRS